MSTSGFVLWSIRVKATIFSPPGIFCTSLYVPCLKAGRHSS